MALQKFDLETKADWLKFKDFATAQSLFDNLKMAVVTGSFSELEDEKEFKKILQSQLENKNFYLVISTNDKVKKRDIPISKIQNLISSSEGDCVGLINEIEKLSLSDNFQSQVSSLKFKADFFGAIQQIARGDLKAKLSNLEILLENDDAAKVFNLLAYTVQPEEQIRMADYDAAVKSGKLEYEEVLLDFML